jgi:large subunit ribosomal protein L9
MDVILLERIARLGQMGDVVRVKDGYARNFLLPKGKALRASDANRKRFESQRADLEARNLERRSEAEAVEKKLGGTTHVIIRQAGETGHLYGSVSARDIAETLEAAGIHIARGQVSLPQPIKTIGMHAIVIALHPEVESRITLNVARSADEAERQARGEDLTVRDRGEQAEEQPAVDVQAMFEKPVEQPAEGGEETVS